MEKSASEIDQIIRDKVLEYNENPSPGFWNRLSRRLYPNDSFRWTLAIVALLSVLGFWMMKSESKVAEKRLETEIISGKSISENISVTSNERKDNEKLKGAVSVQEKIVENLPARAILNLPDPQQDASVQDELVSDNRFPAEAFREVHELIVLEKKQAAQVNANFISSQDTPQPINNGIGKEEKLFTENPTEKFNGVGKWGFSIEVGYAHLWRKVSAEPQFDDFQDMRIQNEAPANTVSYDFKTNYQYKNWFLSVGLGYTTYGEKLHYKLSETVVDPEGGYYDVEAIYLNMIDENYNMVPMLIGYEKTWIDTYKVHYFEENDVNKYAYLEIPISVGYKLNYQRISVCPEVGMSFGFLNKASGRLPLNSVPDFDRLDKESAYLKSTTSSFNIGISLEYDITPNYGLYIQPFFKQSLHSIYKDYPLSVKFQNAGIKFGVNIYL